MTDGYNISFETATSIMIDVLKEDYAEQVAEIKKGGAGVEDAVLRKNALRIVMEAYMMPADFDSFVDDCHSKSVEDGIGNLTDGLDWIPKLLQKQILEIEFKKIDGTDRRIRCTLMDKYVPEKYREQDHSHTSKGIIRGWDLENEGWRSIRLENVKSVRIV